MLAEQAAGRRSRRCLLTVATVTSVLLGPASAWAQPAVDGSAALAPNIAGASPKLTVEARIGKTPAGDFEAPRSIVLAVARGFRYDSRARSQACSAAQANSYTCPSESRIGGGEAEILVSGAIVPGGSATLAGEIDVFLAPRAQPGDLFGVEVQVREPLTGQRARGSGRLVPLATGAFGAELRFESFPQPPQPPPGVTVEVPRIHIEIEANRVVGRSFFSLFRNPATCPTGGWPYELRVAFASGEARRGGAVACAAPPSRPGCPPGGDPIVGTSGNDTRSGSRGRDVLFGLGGNDLLSGLGGADCLYGAGGSDRLSGGSGADRLFGGAGRDRLAGGRGADRLLGGGGADRLRDTSGRDRFRGGRGSDHINSRDRSASGRRRRDRVNCGPGRDRARVDRRDRVARNCERVLRR